MQLPKKEVWLMLERSKVRGMPTQVAGFEALADSGMVTGGRACRRTEEANADNYPLQEEPVEHLLC